MRSASFQSLLQYDATREQLEEWCRSKAQAIPVGADLVLCRVLGKFIMYTLARDSALTPHLALSGMWEPWVTMAIARHIKPGMRCLDVGACYGYFSLLMADIAGDTGHVEAWEPYHADLLQHNASVNGLPIYVVPQAMGPIGTQVIVKPPPSDELKLFNAGGVQVRPDKEMLCSYERRVVAGRPEIGFDFIKVDVEGYEAEVWEALGLPHYDRPVTVCMEFTPSKHQMPNVFLDRIKHDGFVLGTVGHDGVPRPCSHEEALEPDTGDFRMLWLTR